MTSLHKTVFRILVSSLILLSASLGFTETERSSTANINQGDFQLSGSLNYGKQTSGGRTYTSTVIRTSLEYFFINRLSFGGAVRLGKYRSDRFAGPSMSYYFYHKGTFAAYVSQEVLFYNALNVDGEMQVPVGYSKIGIKHFIVPQVAFGLDLVFGYNLRSSEAQLRTTDFNGSFSLYF